MGREALGLEGSGFQVYNTSRGGLLRHGMGGATEARVVGLLELFLWAKPLDTDIPRMRLRDKALSCRLELRFQPTSS